MNFKPTEHQRSVLLSLQFVHCGSAQHGSRLYDAPRISRISGLFAAPDDISVEIFDDPNEAALLRRFWLSLRPNDRIFAAGVAEGPSLLRQRSWLLDVIPAAEIDLRCVYGIQLWDTGRMWISGYAPRHLYIARPGSSVEVGAPNKGELDFEIFVYSCDQPCVDVC